MKKVDDHVTCWKKVLHKTLTDAELDCARLWAYKKRDVVPYKCPTCPFFHISGQGWTAKKIDDLHKRTGGK